MTERQKRSNADTARAVARGVNILAVRDRGIARRYMEYKQVPAGVIVRVLDYPALRREPSAAQSRSEAITPTRAAGAGRQGGPQPSTDAEAATLGVNFDGRAYHYRAYTYDHLSDALAYARLDQARPSGRDQSPSRTWPAWQGPTAAEQELMAAHGITCQQGRFHYGPYRYDTLDAALACARREPGLAPSTTAPPDQDPP